MEQEKRTRKPWNKLLITDIIAALAAVVCFVISITAGDYGPYLLYGFAMVVFYAAALFLTVCILLTPVFLWKRKCFSKALLIVTTIVNALSLGGIIWYGRLVLIFLYD